LVLQNRQPPKVITQLFKTAVTRVLYLSKKALNPGPPKPPPSFCRVCFFFRKIRGPLSQHKSHSFFPESAQAPSTISAQVHDLQVELPFFDIWECRSCLCRWFPFGLPAHSLRWKRVLRSLRFLCHGVPSASLMPLSWSFAL